MGEWYSVVIECLEKFRGIVFVFERRRDYCKNGISPCQSDLTCWLAGLSMVAMSRCILRELGVAACRTLLVTRIAHFWPES